MLTAKRAIEIINEGVKDYNNGVDNTMYWYDRGYWTVRAYTAGRDIAKGRWSVSFEIIEKSWERFGMPNIDRYTDEYIASYNYRDERGENGISVIDDDYKNTIGYHSFLAKGTTLYIISGVQIGWGSDGEPIIIPTSEAKRK
jgi:hypothetical protein